jgi:hypothetical protein
MTFEKIRSPKIPSYTNLGVSYPDEIELTEGSRPLEGQQGEGRSIADLVNDLVSKIQDKGTYNNVTDAVNKQDSGDSYNPEEMLALRLQNRENAKRIRAQIDGLKARYIESVALNSYDIKYKVNKNSKINQFINEYFDRPEDSPQVITSSQYLELKETERRMIKQEGKGIFGEADLNVSDYVSFPNLNSKDKIATRYGIDVVSAGINIIEDSDFSRIPEGIPLGYGLLPVFESVMDVEEQIGGVEEVLARTDEDTSYIESLFNRNLDEPISASIPGRPANYSFKEIMKNCFDCFIGAWNGPVDFKFHLQIELNIKDLLAQLDFLLGRIRFALDIEGIVKSNVCSLFNLGVLCPIEIMFLIASLIGLLSYCALEIVLSFRGFLMGLIASILTPLLNALQLAASFGIGPLNIYMGCVFKTLLTASQVRWTGQMTMAQLVAVHSVISGKGDEEFVNDRTGNREERRQESQRERELRQQEREGRQQGRAETTETNQQERVTRREQRQDSQAQSPFDSAIEASPALANILSPPTGDGIEAPEIFTNGNERVADNTVASTLLDAAAGDGASIALKVDPLSIVSVIPRAQFLEAQTRLQSNPKLNAVITRIKALAMGNQTTIDLEEIGIDFLRLMDESLVAGDASLTSTIAGLEFVEKMMNHYKWIVNALAALKNWASSQSAGRIELSAKIVGLSTLIGVLGAILDLITGRKIPEYCNVKTNPDGTVEITPSASPDVLFNLINQNPSIVLVNDPQEPGTPGGDNINNPVILNTVTGTRIPLINCSKAQPIVLTDREIAELLSNI